MDVRTAVAGVIRTSNALALESRLVGFLRFPEIVGVIMEGTAVVMRRIESRRLDAVFEPRSRIDERRHYELVQNLGKWLRGFHQRSFLTGEASNAFPFHIRPYQDCNSGETTIERCLERIGVSDRGIEAFVAKLERACESLPEESMRLTQTFGDFRVWNVIVSDAGEYLSDVPVVLCRDVPWRDISAMITSIDYVAARPRNMLPRNRIQRGPLSQQFLSTYFDEDPPSVELVEVLKVPAMLASLEDLRQSKRIRDLAASLWIERKVISVLRKVRQENAQ